MPFVENIRLRSGHPQFQSRRLLAVIGRNPNVAHLPRSQPLDRILVVHWPWGDDDQHGENDASDTDVEGVVKVGGREAGEER
jgi:hypothetical protein